MPDFTAIAHIYLKSEDPVAAIGEADDIKLAVERIVDTEIGEGMDIVEVIELDQDPTPHASMMQLRKARNILIRTRHKEAYDIARALDEMVHVMAMQTDPKLITGTYDYSNMMRVLKEVVDGGNPLDH